MNSTLLIIKPGFSHLERLIIGKYGDIGYRSNNKIVETLTGEQVDCIWGDVKKDVEDGRIEDKDYYIKYKEYITSEDVICYELIKEEDSDYSEITKTKKDIRELFSRGGYRDVLHTSDSNENATQEIQCIFGD